MTRSEPHYAILLGADMAPMLIQQQPETANGQFAGIGVVRSLEIADLDLPLPEVNEVWGVVMRLHGDTAPEGQDVPVTLRTGEQFEATVLTDTTSFDDPAAVLAEAYYWELPVTYREALARMVT